MTKSQKVFISISCILFACIIGLMGYGLYDLNKQLDNQTTIVDEEKDPNKTYIEDLFNGENVNMFNVSEDVALLTYTNSQNPGLYQINLSDYSVKQVHSYGYNWEVVYT